MKRCGTDRERRPLIYTSTFISKLAGSLAGNPCKLTCTHILVLVLTCRPHVLSAFVHRVNPEITLQSKEPVPGAGMPGMTGIPAITGIAVIPCMPVIPELSVSHKI